MNAKYLRVTQGFERQIDQQNKQIKEVQQPTPAPIAPPAIPFPTTPIAVSLLHESAKSASQDSRAPPKNATDIYRKCKDAVVLSEGQKKSGTGFVISDDGKIVTNYHVVSGESTVAIKFGSGLELATNDVIAQDPKLDLAILQLKGKGFKAVQIGDSDRVSPVDLVVVISNPFLLEGSVSSGLISGKEKRTGSSSFRFPNQYHTGAAEGQSSTSTEELLALLYQPWLVDRTSTSLFRQMTSPNFGRTRQSCQNWLQPVLRQRYILS